MLFRSSIKMENKTINQISYLRNCIIEYSGNTNMGPIVLDSYNHPDISNITLVNNKYNGLHLLGGAYSRDLILSNTEIPYFSLNDIEVTSINKLILKPGVVLKLSDGKNIIVSGQLQLKGNIGSPCLITSIKDDNIGNYDTNGDGF